MEALGETLILDARMVVFLKKLYAKQLFSTLAEGVEGWAGKGSQQEKSRV